jgi:MFS family permease
MPAFTADYFGPKNVGPIYGLMLTAWGFASAFGPLLIARMRETAGSYRDALHVIAGVMAISTLLPILVHPPRTRDTDGTKTLWGFPRREVGGITSRVATANPPHAL